MPSDSFQASLKNCHLHFADKTGNLRNEDLATESYQEQRRLLILGNLLALNPSTPKKDQANVDHGFNPLL